MSIDDIEYRRQEWTPEQRKRITQLIKEFNMPDNCSKRRSHMAYIGIGGGGSGGSNIDACCARKLDKFAPVAPYHIYQQFLVNGYIPSTVLLLAHDVVANKEGYQQTFADPRWMDTNIIMDNSVVELKKAVDTQMVFEAAEIVCADVVVLPDVMGNAEETLMATQEVYDTWKWKFRNYSMMALIQGADIQDWLRCAEYMKKDCPTPWIGIPRIAEGIQDPNTGRVYSRSHLVDMTYRWLYPNTPIHLFGFSDSIWEDLKAAKAPWVRSIDSAVPLRLDNANCLLSENAGPRGDWWQTATFDKEMINICRRIDQLINS